MTFRLEAASLNLESDSCKNPSSPLTTVRIPTSQQIQHAARELERWVQLQKTPRISTPSSLESSPKQLLDRFSRKEEYEMPWSPLPEEIVHMILDYMDPASLMAMEMVNSWSFMSIYSSSRWRRHATQLYDGLGMVPEHEELAARRVCHVIVQYMPQLAHLTELLRSRIWNEGAPRRERRKATWIAEAAFRSAPFHVASPWRIVPMANKVWEDEGLYSGEILEWTVSYVRSYPRHQPLIRLNSPVYHPFVHDDRLVDWELYEKGSDYALGKVCSFLRKLFVELSVLTMNCTF